MFHSDEEYFNECLDLCRALSAKGVSFVPRIIGEIESRDLAGKKATDKEFHSYTSSQLERLDEYYAEMRNAKVEGRQHQVRVLSSKVKSESVRVQPPSIDNNPIVSMAA